jgi:hypothetical protein
MSVSKVTRVSSLFHKHSKQNIGKWQKRVPFILPTLIIFSAAENGVYTRYISWLAFNGLHLQLTLLNKVEEGRKKQWMDERMNESVVQIKTNVND